MALSTSADIPCIRYVDGPRLRRAILAGASRVIQHQRHLDEINVFPVPDSDTGTNLAATLRSMMEAAGPGASWSVGEISERLADAALMGAKGNSGAILAQFFTGLAEGLRGLRRASTEAFAEATAQAARWAHDAIQHPREGTILTVIRAWAEAVQQAGQKTGDFHEVMAASLEQARAALQKTPEQMAVLKKAGVVDAGALGFVYLLEGVVAFIREGTLKAVEAVSEEVPVPAVAHMMDVPEDLTFRYCTECLVNGSALDRTALQQELAHFGDSLVVAGSLRKLRIHLHTDQPGVVFERLRAHGTVAQEKVDDMRLQQRDAHAATRPAIAVVVDTGCDLPDDLLDRHHIHPVPLRVHFGEEAYIDRYTLSSDDFFRKLVSYPVHPTTSQPVPADLRRAYDLVLRLYEGAVSIHVPARLSGTYQAAVRASAHAASNVAVVDGRTVSVGLGLLALEAVNAAEEGLALDAVVRRVEQARGEMRTFIALETMTYVVRGGRLSRWKGLLARLLNLKPVLTFNPEGELTVAAKVLGTRRAHQKTLALVRQYAEGRKNLRFAIAHGHAPETAVWYADQIRRFCDPALLYIAEISPALGVHGGPGVAGVAVLGDRLIGKSVDQRIG